jgi:hypothetical protein
MSILPQRPTETDVLADRQDRVKRFLAARGDPNIAIPFQLLCMMLPSSSDGYCDNRLNHRNWLDADPALSSSSIKHAVTHAHVVDTEVSILQFASLLERPHMAAAVLDNAQKPITLAPSPSSLLPTPLLLAAMYKAPNSFSGVSPLTSKASFGSLSVVESLLARGVDPCGLDIIRSTSRSRYVDNSPSSSPPLVTPLMLACLHGRHAIAASLVQSGGVGQSATRKSLANLLVACALSCSVRCFMLIRRGREAAVDSIVSKPITADGRTLLHFAVLAHLCGDTVATEHGCDDECSSESDYEERRAHFCQLLVALGCPVDAAATGTSLAGDTALHLAWSTGKSALARTLVVDMMANPAIHNDRGELPFECHAILMSSVQIALQGGICNLVQDAGPQSSLSYIDFLLQWVYPQCLESTQARRSLLRSLVSPSQHNGWNALHSLCSSVYWMHHANQHDMVRIAHRLCQLLTLLLTEDSTPTTSASCELKAHWINRPVIAEVAGELRMTTPLVLAVDAGAPLALIHLLLHYGADAVLQPAVPQDVVVPNYIRLAPSFNAFQAIAALRSPYAHIGDAAMMLLLAATALMHPAQSSTPVVASIEGLNSIPTHPTNPHVSMMELPVVQTHPYWQTFFEVLVPPVDEKDRRRREANRFKLFQRGAVDSLVAEIEPVPPTVPFALARLPDGATAKFSTVSTPLVNVAEPQGAFVVVVHPEPRSAPTLVAHPSDQVSTLPLFEDSRKHILRLRQEWSFQTRLSAMLEHYDTSVMPARNFFYEQELQQPRGNVPNFEDADNALVSLSEWISSQPDGSMVASYFIVRFAEWLDVLEGASDGDAAYAAMCDYTRARSLGLLRHVEHLHVDEAVRQRDVCWTA